VTAKCPTFAPRLPHAPLPRRLRQLMKPALTCTNTGVS